MATTSVDPDEANVPWGKYSYNLEGLASGCYMEGLDPNPRPVRLPSTGQRLRFRVELPARCFVLSVGIKLPNAPKSVLNCLEDVVIERGLNGDFQAAYDPALFKNAPSACTAITENSASRSSSGPTDDVNNESPTSVDQTSTPQPQLTRKKFMHVRRAADSLRISITDIDDSSKTAAAAKNSESESDASDGMDQRTLGIVVIGYTRGQTPAPSKLKILLNVSAHLDPQDSSKIDRAEIDGLLGLAFLGGRRYRQAAELLQRAADLNLQVAEEDASGGMQEDDTLSWAAQLNLLSAHAYFEHSTMSNDGIIRLIQVAAAYGKPNPHQIPVRDVRDLSADSLDLRTELLNMLENLVNMLVRFLGDTSSSAARMAAARMIEFISEQLGCGMAPHMANILNTVLRSYPSCTAFGARDRAAAASFEYDSMEDCFERLTDIYCRLLPLTEHTVLHRLYDNTLIPVFLDAFRESDYLHTEIDGEVVDDLMSTSVAQTLRVIYLSLMVLGADARIPTSVLSRLLNILVLENGFSRTSLILRRTALHTWDSVTQALVQSASGNNVKAFAEHFKMLTSYIPKLLVEQERTEFEYREVDDDNEVEVKIFKEDELKPKDGAAKIERLLEKRKTRIEIADRHTLGRVVSLLTTICKSLSEGSMQDDDIVHNEVLFNLQECLGKAIADLALSSLLDVSYHNAVVSGNEMATEGALSFEFGDLDNQLNIVCEVIEELFECYWPCLSLLPSRMMDEAARTTPVRTLLGWCVFRMKTMAPPRGMIQLICACVRGLKNIANISMHGVSKDDSNPSEVTFLSIYRTHLIWLPKTEYVETFELLDILSESVAGDLLANDLLLLIRGLGDQSDELQAQTEASLKSMSTIVAASAPRDPDHAIKSLQDLHLVHHTANQTERLSKAFPKSARSGGSFNKRMSNYTNQSRQEPMVKSFYLHVVLSSCFDRFDALARATQQRAGPSYMAEKIDAFVEHARFAVRCLHDCARSQQHRQYVGAILGDIFATCLAMEDHSDGRVRRAGFEIFAASLDVLFLAQKSTKLRSQQPSIPGGRAAVISIPTSPSFSHSVSMENINGVSEVNNGLHGDEDNNGNPTISATSRSITMSELKAVRTGSGDSPKGMGSENADDDDNDDEGGDQKMMEILSDGGPWRFHIEDTSSDDLAFEEKAWQMLCLFISSSLSVERVVDSYVQRLYLEYLRGCIMNALRGRSSGASVITFEHIEIIWDAVSRLVGSPWRALNSLAMWVICAVVNVALYASIVKSNKSASRQRSSQLTDFVNKHVFQRAESLLKSTSREGRIWGMRLLEVYVRSRSLNTNFLLVIPPAPNRVLRCLKTLNNDWEEDVQKRSKKLLDVHLNSLNRRASHVNSSTVQSHFLSIKRHMVDESSQVELWFPPLPKQLKEQEIRAYHLKLESFASAPIAGGEEINLVKIAEDEMEDEDDEDEDEEEEEGDDAEEELSVGEEQRVENEQEAVEENGVEVEHSSAHDGGNDEEHETDEEDAANDDEDEDEEVEDEAVMVRGKSGNDDSNSQDSDEIDNADEKATDLGSPSSVASTDAEAESNGSELDDLESPKKPSDEKEDNPDDVDKPKATDDENLEEDEDFDHEFSPQDNSTKDSEVANSEVVAVSVDHKDETAPVSKTEEPQENEYDEVEDDEDDEDVVNVTDVDDILMEFDSIAEDDKIPRKPERINSFGLTVSSMEENKSVIDELDGGLKKDNLTSPKVNKLNSNLSLNPDEDEGKKVLRRMGSFTGRAPKQTTIEEGEAPRLERRRSVDVGSMSGINKGDLDETSQKNLHRLSRKSYSKSLGTSPKANDPNWRLRGPPDSMDEEQASFTRVPRRKSMKNVTLGASTEGRKSADRSSEGESDDGSHETGLGGLSTADEKQVPSSPSRDQHREGKDVNDLRSPSRSGSGGFRQGRRSLPRAKAFVKGGGLGFQRRNSRDEDADSAASEGRGETSGNSGLGSMSSPSMPSSASGSKGRLPRAKSQAGRGSLKVPSEAAADIVDGLERRPDRSHRYSRRETAPFALSLDDADEFEKDLLSDMEAKRIGDGSNSPGGRNLTPTAEAAALMNRKSLLGDKDGPSGGSFKGGNSQKRRGSRRDTTAEVAQQPPDAGDSSEGADKNKDKDNSSGDGGKTSKS